MANDILALLQRDLTKTELKSVKKSLVLCKENLSWSLRGDGTTDYDHSMRVAMILITEFKTKEYLPIILAILHDIAERSPALIIDIETIFGSEIAGLTQLLSRDDSYKNRSRQIESILKIRQNYKYNGAPYVVRLVKCADKIDNLRNLENISRKYSKHKNIPYWIVEAKTSVLPLAEKTDRKAFVILKNLIETFEPQYPLPN